jgi:hypothetical protein
MSQLVAAPYLKGSELRQVTPEGGLPGHIAGTFKKGKRKKEKGKCAGRPWRPRGGMFRNDTALAAQGIACMKSPDHRP